MDENFHNHKNDGATPWGIMVAGPDVKKLFSRGIQLKKLCIDPIPLLQSAIIK